MREKLSRLCHLIFVHSEYGQKELQSMYPWIADRIISVLHGNYEGFYKCSLTKKDIRYKLGIPENSLVYLLFGQWKSHKNIETIVDVFRKLKKKQSNAQLLLVGQNCQELNISSQMYKNIHSFEGYIDTSEVGQYFLASDYFLAAAQRSYGSGSLLLAQTYGLPVIGQSQGDIKEIIGNNVNGFLVGDERYGNKSFLETISLTETLPEHKYNEMRSASFETSKQRDWKDTVVPLVDFLSKMVCRS